MSKFNNGLKELIEMWRETASMVEDHTPLTARIYNDCANQLEEFVSGDYSGIEKVKYDG